MPGSTRPHYRLLVTALLFAAVADMAVRAYLAKSQGTPTPRVCVDCDPMLGTIARESAQASATTGARVTCDSSDSPAECDWIPVNPH
ncbi:MAG: hypothetical protein NT069_13775 [Planctomycetota bacterium]|nr:hypothetical protein [Planctomycetota bacterium]